MASPVRWDPFGEMRTLQRNMDRLFDDTFRSMQTQPSQEGDMGLALDVSEDENEYKVKASVPGINPEDIAITIDQNVLTIAGESEHEEEREQGQYHLRERRVGRFSRSLRLPTAVDAENIDASCENGVLTVHLPKSEHAKPRRIAVQNRQTIEGESSTQSDGQAKST